MAYPWNQRQSGAPQRAMGGYWAPRNLLPRGQVAMINPNNYRPPAEFQDSYSVRQFLVTFIVIASNDLKLLLTYSSAGCSQLS
jgi:hypothetical protein